MSPQVDYDELERLLEAANDVVLPLTLRPDEYDDWGTIKGADGRHIARAAINYRRLTQNDLSEHRRNNTDPTQDRSALIVATVNALPTLLAEHKRDRAGMEAMREALEQIAIHDEGDTASEEAQSRIKWIDAELEAEPSRLPFGTDGQPPCRNGYELVELIAERAGLIARQALAALKADSQEGER